METENMLETVNENREEKDLYKGRQTTVMEASDLRRLVKRAGETGDFIRRHAALCVGCGHCEKICPVGVWHVKKNKAILADDYQEKCVECGSCWLVCDAGAIEFSYPTGGTGVVWEYG